MISKVVLSVGSNCDRCQVAKATEWLLRILSDARSSSLYQTPAVHGDGVPYVNSVVEGGTILSISEFNSLLKEYEIEHGRTAAVREKGLVPVDIDIVIWNEDVVRPRDFRHSFFQIGYSELAGTVVESKTYR